VLAGKIETSGRIEVALASPSSKEGVKRHSTRANAQIAL